MRASWHQEYVLIYRMAVLNAKGKEKNSCLKGSGLRCSLHINTDEFSSRTQASQSWWQGMNLPINIGVSDYGANICYLVNTQEYCTVNQDLTRDVLLYTLTCICTRVDHTCELNVSRKSKYAAQSDWNELLACAVSPSSTESLVTTKSSNSERAEKWTIVHSNGPSFGSGILPKIQEVGFKKRTGFYSV